MMFNLSNEILSVKISEKGAELQSIFHLPNNLEYLWSGDKKFWAKKSPVLFPIVGGLKNNTYTFIGKDYKLSRHGFARDHIFQLKEQSESSITFCLASSEQTKAIYPFDFLFCIKYSLEKNQLRVAFSVENTGSSDMFFSVGAHPAFAVPLNEKLAYEDYYLQFSQPEKAQRWPLSADGLIEKESIPFLDNEDQLPLRRELFYKDAIVLKDLQSNSISILSHQSANGVKVTFDGFPYMGIWAAKYADFVCIEPWYGIADSVTASGNLIEKEGIIKLEAGGLFERSYSIEVF